MDLKRASAVVMSLGLACGLVVVSVGVSAAAVTGSLQNLTADGNQGSSSPTVSADGSTLGFSSSASNLTPGDNNNQEDTFVWDATNGFRNLTTGGNGRSWPPSLSADGSTVVFASDASNLTPSDTNGVLDVFVWDRASNSLMNLTALGNGSPSSFARTSVSADGATVAFASNASNLTPGDNNGQYDVFVWNGESGFTNLTADGDGNSAEPSISADGSRMAFFSNASNLTPGDTNGVADVFVWDRASNSLTNLTGTGNGVSYMAAVSGDGSTVAFVSVASNLTPGDTNGKADVFIWNADNGLTNLTATADDHSFEPSISADGSTVAFHSDASNLAPGGNDNRPNGFGWDVLVWDADNGFKNLSATANSGSFSPSVSADGATVAFYSGASNLTSNDINGQTDVLVWTRDPAPEPEPDPDPEPEPEPAPTPAPEPTEVIPTPVNDFRSAPNLVSLIRAANFSNELDAPILRLYQAYFNRQPDLAGAKYWLDIRRLGHDQWAIAGFMTGSVEFSNNYEGTTDKQYLTRVYQNMLGRAYDQGGFNYWLDLLEGRNNFGGNTRSDKLTRSGVVFYVASGQEFITNYPYTK